MAGLPGTVELDQLGLEGPVQGLGHGVVVVVSDGADGRRDAGLGEPVGVAETRILAGLRVMNEVAVGQVPPPQRHLQGVEDEVGAEVAGDLPADDGAAVDVRTKAT